MLTVILKYFVLSDANGNKIFQLTQLQFKFYSKDVLQIKSLVQSCSVESDEKRKLLGTCPGVKITIFAFEMYTSLSNLRLYYSCKVLLQICSLAQLSHFACVSVVSDKT